MPGLLSDLGYFFDGYLNNFPQLCKQFLFYRSCSNASEAEYNLGDPRADNRGGRKMKRAKSARAKVYLSVK